jgi:AGCS family alanine or glycine:cation symporter
MVGGKLGTWIVAIGLFMFAYSTIIGWSYYGERCAYYLGGQKVILPYRIVYIAVAGLGCVATNLDMIWNISDVFNGFMAIPNLIGLLGLSGIIAKETKDFNAIIKAEKAEAKALKQAVPEPVAVKK